MMLGERYVYQRSSHQPPWAICYDTFYSQSGVKVYATIYSEEIRNSRNAIVFTISATSPYHVAQRIKSKCADYGITFTEQDFRQIQNEFKWSFK